MFIWLMQTCPIYKELQHSSSAILVPPPVSRFIFIMVVSCDILNFVCKAGSCRWIWEIIRFFKAAGWIQVYRRMSPRVSEVCTRLPGQSCVPGGLVQCEQGTVRLISWPSKHYQRPSNGFAAFLGIPQGFSRALLTLVHSKSDRNFTPIFPRLD